MTPFRLILFVFVLACSSSVAALPVVLNEAEFNAEIATLPSTIETFNAFAPGAIASPVTFANGIYEGEASILNGLWCISSPCLTVGVMGGNFRGFPAGTSHWSGRIIVAGGNPTNVLEMTVTGNSGSQVFTLPPMGFANGGVFVGFRDISGLRTISFRLVSGGSNFSFDNITTAGNVQVAAPISVESLSGAGMVTLVALLLAFAWMARPRRSAARCPDSHLSVPQRNLVP